MKRPKAKPEPVEQLPTDEFLRLLGFRIWSRPEKGANIWERRGVRLTQDQALAVAKRELRAGGS